jgi:integrase
VILLERTKSGKRREVPMNSATDAALHALGDKAEGYVFRKMSGVAWGSIRTAFERAVSDAKLDDFTFHDLRHTFASHFMMRGGNLAELRDLLGHADVKMTTRYAHLSPSHLRAAVDKLEGLTPVKVARISTPSTHEVESDPLPLVSVRNAGVAQRQSN